MLIGMVSFLVTKTLVSMFLPSIAAQAAAFSLMVWARRTLGRRSFHLAADPSEGELITIGPYRFVRHPIYAAVCLFAWAATLGSPSIQTLFFSGLVTSGAVLRIFCEEHLNPSGHMQQYGAEIVCCVDVFIEK